MNETTNGTPTIPVVSAIELLDRAARYRTAIVALLELIKRDGGYMATNDQMLVREVERLLERK